MNDITFNNEDLSFDEVIEKIDIEIAFYHYAPLDEINKGEKNETINRR